MVQKNKNAYKLSFDSTIEGMEQFVCEHGAALLGAATKWWCKTVVLIPVSLSISV
jgi:hypothetical protein